MPATPAAAMWAVAAITAATATYQGVAANQQTQHAKGAAQAQQTEMDAQVKAANDLDITKQKQSSDAAAAAAAGNANAMAKTLYARRQSSILTDPTSDQSAPTTTKTLLGS